MAAQPFIPATMMTQHPDSASRYVPVRDEPKEAIDALTPQPIGLGLEEVMVDYEGKLTPYHQTAEISLGLLERGQTPGRDVLVTPRVPSATKETSFHQLMALMSVIESNYQMSLSGGGAICEVIVPMVETAAELMDVRRRIEDVIELGYKEFGTARDASAVQVIPLIEEVPELLGARSMLRKYIDGTKDAGYKVDRLRVMLGRSDSAMAYGMVPSVLAVKTAIADCYRLGREQDIEIFPIYGGGALPFRGHVTLGNFDQLVNDYAGVRTVTIQSGLRYDIGGESARQVAIRARDELEQAEPLAFSADERDAITAMIGLFTTAYLESFDSLLPVVIAISDVIPAQRDRLARKSAVGYARAAAAPHKLAAEIDNAGVAGLVAQIKPRKAASLPRAISYTGALYSIGLPPEFIGTGRGLKAVKDHYGGAGMEMLLRFYPGIRADLARAACYASLRTSAMHIPKSLLPHLESDLEEIALELGIEPGPVSQDDKRYHVLLETVQPMLRQLAAGGQEWTGEVADRQLVTEWICRLGKLRGSLG